MVQALGRVENFFKLHRILLSIIGVWPYQKPVESRLAMSNFCILAISQMTPQFLGMLKVRDDFDKVIECLTALGIGGLCWIKLINLMVNIEKMKGLLTGIQKDFDGAISETEIMIFQRYGKRSRKLSKLYAIYIYTAAVLFVGSPIVESFTTPIPSNEMNETGLRRLPYMVDYVIIDNTDDYFYLIIIHAFFSTMAYITVLVSVDAMCTVYLQHGCTKFMILKYQLSQLIEPGELDTDIHCPEPDDPVYRKTKFCVRLHKEAMDYAEAIESAFSTAQLFQVGLICLLMSVIGLNAVTKLHSPDELVRFVGVIFALMLQLFVYSWQSNELMDHSINVSGTVYNTEWYRLSLRTRKLLLQIMTRSAKECKITAGGLVVMSMESYSKILSNSMSYFTLLSSVQERPTTTDTE